jgi:hypothetical protein
VFVCDAPAVNQEQQELAQQSLEQAVAAAPEEALIEGGAAPMGLTNALMDGGIDLGGGLRLSREYIWGPGDSWGASPVDELLVYYAEDRVPWWPLQDAGSDVVAVCDQSGPPPTQGGSGHTARVVAQQTYDAYGQVTTADHIYNHPFLAAGHKGLFYDRFDRGASDATAPGSSVPPFAAPDAAIETPKLVPFARGVYHVRNRAYIPGGGSPSLLGLASLSYTGPPGNTWQVSQNGLSSGAAVQGRWMQADPNATGMVVESEPRFHGRALDGEVNLFDLTTRFGNGPDLYEYLEGGPWTHADPTGLDLFTDVASFGFEVTIWTLRGGMESMTDQYATNMESDVEWALDWDMGDDWHTRGESSWIARSFARGIWNGLGNALTPWWTQFLPESIRPEWPQAGVIGDTARAGAKFAGKVLKSMKDLARLTIYESKKAADAARKAEGGTGHSHHLVERQIVGKASWSKGLRAGEGPSVVIKDTNFHLSYMRIKLNEAYAKIGVLPGKMTRAEAKRAVEIAYRDCPRLRNEAWKYLDGR